MILPLYHSILSCSSFRLSTLVRFVFLHVFPSFSLVLHRFFSVIPSSFPSCSHTLLFFRPPSCCLPKTRVTRYGWIPNKMDQKYVSMKLLGLLQYRIFVVRKKKEWIREWVELYVLRSSFVFWLYLKWTWLDFRRHDCSLIRLWFRHQVEAVAPRCQGMANFERKNDL